MFVFPYLTSRIISTFETLIMSSVPHDHRYHRYSSGDYVVLSLHPIDPAMVTSSAFCGKLRLAARMTKFSDWEQGRTYLSLHRLFTIQCRFSPMA